MELMISASFLTWMEWTLPSAIFFIVIFLILVGMAIWQSIAPSVERRGFLPIPTTPGDRLFIGLLSSAYIFLVWVGLTELSLWIMLALIVCWMLVVMRWG
jgi:predicted small integral membrane protein